MSNFGFVKIYGSLLSSTVWVGQPWHRKLMWITMLAKADQDGYVASSIPGLARDAEVTLEQCEDALAHFLSPDRYSRTKDYAGIRIEEVDGGWVVLNHKKYRELRTREAVLNARRVAKHVAKKKAERAAAPSPPGNGKPPAGASGTISAVSAVSSHSTNDQKQIQISEADPDQEAKGGAKDRSSSARATPPEPSPPLWGPPEVERLDPDATRAAPHVASAAPHVASRDVPPEWVPKEHHRINAQLYGLDFETELATFRATAFKAAYWDWDKRFDRWLLDRRVERQTSDFREQQRAPRSPGAGGATLRLQPNNGVTGWEADADDGEDAAQ